jgi:2-polyprenyl-6-methoxyphenol hydroxylase-like FAD-dependent oxidoreductase
MCVLISGAGIAGPTLAHWLYRYGMQPTLVEQASSQRTGGYVIDFWGAGFDVADRMGLVPELGNLGYRVEEVRVVDRRGRRVAGFPVSAFNSATGGRYVSLSRGDLAAAIFRTLEGKVECRFGDSVTHIEEREDGARVSFDSGITGDFDLVIGADGLHSNIRQLAFGPECEFEKYLGFKVAAFESRGYRPRDELAYVMFTEPGQQVARFSMRDDRTMFLFVFADRLANGPGMQDVKAQKALLRSRFGDSGWECRKILEAMDSADHFYFDRVSQIRMTSPGSSWSRGRVALVGDAAFCVSLLAGQGSALAMAAAYILAGELHRAKGNYGEAAARYEQLFRPFVEEKQKSAVGFAGAFAPKTRLGLFVRNQLMNLMGIPWIAKLAAGKALMDRIEIRDYGE